MPSSLCNYSRKLQSFTEKRSFVRHCWARILSASSTSVNNELAKPNKTDEYEQCAQNIDIERNIYLPPEQHEHPLTTRPRYFQILWTKSSRWSRWWFGCLILGWLSCSIIGFLGYWWLLIIWWLLNPISSLVIIVSKQSWSSMTASKPWRSCILITDICVSRCYLSRCCLFYPICHYYCTK